MKNLTLLLNTAVLGAALCGTFATLPTLRAEEPRTWHDQAHNEDHKWDTREDKAYRMWVKEQHRKYKDFGKLKEEERQSYWGWRHDHSDAILKLDIR